MNDGITELDVLLKDIELSHRKTKKHIDKNNINKKSVENFRSMQSFKILSIDPSLCGTGYAIFDDKQSILVYGDIFTSTKDPIEVRLYNIYNNLKSIIEIYRPNILIIEKMFLNINGKTSMNIAAVRGIVLLLCGEYKIEYLEIIATSVRKIVIGSGRAKKPQVRDFITNILASQNITLNNPSHNIIDAIAVGMYFFKIIEY